MVKKHIFGVFLTFWHFWRIFYNFNIGTFPKISQKKLSRKTVKKRVFGHIFRYTGYRLVSCVLMGESCWKKIIKIWQKMFRRKIFYISRYWTSKIEKQGVESIFAYIYMLRRHWPTPPKKNFPNFPVVRFGSLCFKTFSKS